MTLRSEVVDENMHGADAVAWREAVHRWREYVEESRESGVVFENASGDRVRGSNPNRFDPAYGDKQYAKLKDLERGLRADYGKRLHTAMVSLTASTTDESGDPIPPVDHLDGPEGLLASWSAVTRALRRAMEGRRYERLAILEPHQSGYIHVHVAVFVEGVVTPEDFRPVIEAHLENCGRAGREAHRIEGDDPEASAVSVKHVGTDRSTGEIENLGTYLAEYLGTYEDPLEQEDHVQACNALLWATEVRRWRPSQPDYLECSGCGTRHHPEAVCHECGSDETEPRPPDYSKGAQHYMSQAESDEGTEWSPVGIEDGAGDLHEFPTDEEGNVDAPGGVARTTTFTARGIDPPPEEQRGGSGWGGLRSDPGEPWRAEPADD